MKFLTFIIGLLFSVFLGYSQKDTVTLNNKNHVAVSHEFAHFNQGLLPWNTSVLEAKFLKNSWVFATRINGAERFNQFGFSIEQDIYKKFESKDYLYLNGSYSPSPIYAKIRGEVEYFNAFSKVWEHSQGIRYLQFQDTLNVFIGTASLSKYSGRFLSTLRINAGFQNSTAIQSLYGQFKQRYYYHDDAYSELYFGYGYDPSLVVFANNPTINILKNTTFNLGFKSVFPITQSLYLEPRVEYQWYDFGALQRHQMTYFLKFYYTWK